MWPFSVRNLGHFFLSHMLSVSRSWLILKIISQSWLILKIIGQSWLWYWKLSVKTDWYWKLSVKADSWYWNLSVKADSDTENYRSVLVQRQIQYDFTNKNNNVSSEDYYIIYNPKYHSSSYWTCCDTCDDFCLDFYDCRYSIYISVLDWITNNLLFNRLVLG